MKISVALLLAATVVAAAFAEKQVAVDAPPAKNRSNKPPPLVGRHRRAATCGTPTKLNSDQAAESVAAHNLFRSLEPANNMQKLEWSDEMAAVAQAWADKCQWEHGMLNDCSGNRIGQNLFVEASKAGYPKFNLTYSIEAWNNERYDWDKATQSCKAGKICGHWTQLVHAKSAKVGCAYAQCPTMNVAGSVWENALYVVCDYTPPGNVMGEPFYLEGGAKCSNCDSDGTGQGYKCEKDLCVKCSKATDSTCQCGKNPGCVNGVWSDSTCTCQCKAGFYGTTCDNSCADVSPDCKYYADGGYCTAEDYSEFMNKNCQATCGYGAAAECKA